MEMAKFKGEIMKLLDGKKALITGARKGIGRGIAYRLAEQGADVGINDYIDDEETQKTAGLVKSLGMKSSIHIQDVSKKEMEKMSVKKKHGGRITYRMTGGQVVDAGYD